MLPMILDLCSFNVLLTVLSFEIIIHSFPITSPSTLAQLICDPWNHSVVDNDIHLVKEDIFLSDTISVVRTSSLKSFLGKIPPKIMLLVSNVLPEVN